MWSTYLRLNLTVWATPREVIHAASKVILKEFRYGREKRDQRRAFYRRMLECHNQAISLYQGHFS